MQPLVSILIPAYNAAQWIAETIQSAQAQTWPRKEIIVVDDGSKDNTLAIVRRFESSGVKVVTQTNQGGSAARNVAFAISQGDYIQWLDADDLLLPDKIANQIESAGRRPSPRTVFSSGWGSFYYRPRKAKFNSTDLWKTLSPIEWLMIKYASCIYMPPATWLISREVTQAAGPWDTRLTYDDDGEYFSRVISKSDGVHFAPEAKSLYRHSGSGSMSYVGKSGKKMESLMLSMQLHLQHILAVEDSARVKTACLKYLQWWSFYFVPSRPDLVRETEKLATSLGGHLQPPRLWNERYAYVQKMFGWNAAKRAQSLFPQMRTTFSRSWDKALFRLGGQNS
jgi:glycosyltransferase involved in cell wall biosynthesis